MGLIESYHKSYKQVWRLHVLVFVSKIFNCLSSVMQLKSVWSSSVNGAGFTLNYDYLVTYIVPQVKNHLIIFTNNNTIYCTIQAHKVNTIHSTHNYMKKIKIKIKKKLWHVVIITTTTPFLFLVPYIRPYQGPWVLVCFKTLQKGWEPFPFGSQYVL